ncbi:helix-turn-helix domain-containing protein [Virgibacillus byunsanensis]|uniref:Helix-turn-helix domain-containing protein n=1 Tax=Virgibacillus byunsanensis TaxID=570945 RepID=A0ABW3LMD6_9BACI
MKSEDQLMSLINAAQVLTSTLDVNKVLELLITEIMNVVDGADAGVLFIYESDINKLVPKSAVGFNMNFLQMIQLELDEGMSGKTFTSKTPNIFTIKQDTEIGMANLFKKNQFLYQQALGEMLYPTSTISAPLLSKNKCIGVLTIDSYSENVHFTNTDLKLLEIFASQALIAIENATLFSINKRSNKIHNKLAEVSLNRKGIKDITSALSSIINKKVAIFNEFLDLAAYSSIECKNITKSLMFNSYDLLKEIIKRDYISHEIINEKTKVYCFPIKHDKLNIGVLMVFTEENSKLDSLDQAAIDQTIIIFAMEMTKHQDLLSHDFNYESYLLEQLLDNKFKEFNIAIQNHIQIQGEVQYIFVNLELIVQLDPFPILDQKKNQFRRLIYRALNQLRFKTFVLEQNLTFKFLFVLDNYISEKDVFEEIEKFFERILNKSKELNNFEFSVGVGRLFHQSINIQSSIRDAKRCVEYLKTQNYNNWFCSYRELGAHRLLLNQNTEELMDYVNDILGKLITYDSEHKTMLTKTLKAYIESKYNMKIAAQKCFVHVNTMKYRMKVIKKILNKTTLKGKDYFNLQLAIFIFEYLNESDQTLK